MLDITKLPVDKKGGALVYARKDNKKDGEIMFALVHDVFGYWTISKGTVEEGEKEDEATIREIKEEVNLVFIPWELFYTSEDSWFELNRFLWTWEWSVKIKEDELNWYGWFTYEEIIKLEIAFDNRKVLDLLKEKNLID